MKKKRLEELKTRLMERRYSRWMVDREIAMTVSREEAMKQVQVKEKMNS